MAKKLSKYGLNVKLDTETATVNVTMFERADEGDEKTDIGNRTYRPADLEGKGVHTQVLLYGLSKVLQDRTSSESASRARLEEMDKVWERLMEDQWEKERESTGPVISPEVEALAALQGVTVGDIQKSLRTYTEEQRRAILEHEAVVEKANEIRAARESQADSGGVDLGQFMAA